MGKFAFMVHPLSLDDVYRYEPKLKRKDPQLVRNILLKWVRPFVVKEVTFTSPQGVSATGLIIFTPLLPEHFTLSTSVEARVVMEKLEEAARLAEAAGAALIGLGALTAIVGGHGTFLAERLDIGVTTGNCFTAAVAVQSVKAVAKKRKLDLGKAKLTTIGATGSIGKACARMLACEVNQLTLVARGLMSLKELAEEIAWRGNKNIAIETDVQASLPGSDIVILCTSDATLSIDRQALKRDAIVINLSQPPNIDLNSKPSTNGLLLIDGGKVIPPPRKVLKLLHPQFPITPGIDSREIFACYAETVILALEQHRQDFSIGRDLPLEKIEEISSLAHRHGFSLPEIV